MKNILLTLKISHLEQCICLTLNKAICHKQIARPSLYSITKTRSNGSRILMLLNLIIKLVVANFNHLKVLIIKKADVATFISGS